MFVNTSDSVWFNYDGQVECSWPDLFLVLGVCEVFVQYLILHLARS